jgi:hypothetical protein
MTQAVPSRIQIDAAVHTLASAGRFERLAGEMLRVEWPERFANITDFGTNVAERTRAGWPDLVAVRSDGTIDAAEVTYGVSQWQRHLAEDVQKVSRFAAGSIASFTFVSWSARPAIDELLSYLATLDEAGLSPGRVRFLFREDIVELLSNPRFARLWQDPLQLRASPWPFQIIQDVSTLFGSDSSPERFKPTREDFSLGRVHLPPIFGVVKAALLERRIAVISGRGASGKTVFATAMAYAKDFANLPTFYLDLDEPGGPLGSALESLTMFGSERTLFVIDNAHLDLHFANQIYQHCRHKSSDSRLLIVRRASSRPVEDGSEEPLAELSDATHELIVETTDIAGVYRRLMDRFYVSAPVPPATALRQWGASFSGDLAVFSAAVANRNKSLVQGEWNLNYDDAAELIRDRYLKQTTSTERNELTAIALASSYEAALPYGPRDPTIPQDFIRSGIVIITRKGEQVNRRFAHPSLGALALSILGTEHRDGALRNIVQRDPLLAVRMAMRSMDAANEGGTSDADISVLLRAIASSEQAIARALSSPASIPALASLFRTAGILTLDAFDALLVKYYSHVRSAIVMQGTTINAALIEFSAQLLPAFYTLLCEDLRDEAFADAIVLKYLTRSIQSLPGLMTTLDKWSPAVGNYIGRRMSSHFNVAAASIATGDAGASSTFLRFLAAAHPATYTAIRTAIVGSPNLFADFVASLVKSGLRQLTAILSFLHGFDNDLYRRSVIRLFRNSRSEVAASVVHTRLRQLSAAFEFMGEHLRTLHDYTLELVITRDFLSAIAINARSETLGEIAHFIEHHPATLNVIATAVLTDLRRPDGKDALTQRIARAPLHDVRAFIAVAQTHLPEICASLIHSLRQPAVLDALAARIAEEPNEHFIGFVRMMEIHEPLTGMELLSRFEDEGLMLVLARRLFDAPMHAVAQIIQYFGVASLRTRLIDAMVDVADQITTAKSFYRPNTLHWLLAECTRPDKPIREKYLELGREVRGLPRSYIAVARALESSLPALARHAASVMVSGGDVAAWQRTDLEALLHCVRFASWASANQRQEFLRQVARRSWLTQQYKAAAPGQLARITFFLWLTLEFAERQPFVYSLLDRQLSRTFAEVTNDATIAVQLIASAKLLHRDLRVRPGLWMSDAAINVALEEMLNSRDRTQNYLSFRTAAFWAGLKVLSRMRRTEIQVRSELGEETLMLWSNAEPRSERIQRFNRVMINWLVMCAARGWRLAPDLEPFDP